MHPLVTSRLLYKWTHIQLSVPGFLLSLLAEEQVGAEERLYATFVRRWLGARGRQSRGRVGMPLTLSLCRGNPRWLRRPCLYQNQVLGIPGEDFMKALIKYELRGRESRELWKETKQEGTHLFFYAYVKYIHLVAEMEGSQIKTEEDSAYAFYKNTVH